MPPNAWWRHLAPKYGEKQREGGIGIPFPDTLYKTVRVGITETADYGEDGEICILGPLVMIGYVDEWEPPRPSGS